MDKLLIVKEVSQIFQINHYTVRRLARDEKIYAIKIGGQWRFDLDEIKKNLKGN